ncbi:amidase [Dongia rigui]|uniref:Amidase n=1 Tax=Dongia rigui TaxID=940149 RepID=A0ABU5E0J3_9PROT|nr:amidase [Dongia rigui]MDY0872705.1 amidase [Dongia rigui]
MNQATVQRHEAWRILQRLGALAPEGEITLEPTGSGPLNGLTFAVKDLFDVAGYVTGCGNPDWKRTHKPATRHAVSVERLLGAGARAIGKVITDELAFSLNGQNFHYGTPRNSAAPDRIPGGSSAGSAAAVAGGACDLALGTDTGGSVRIPAALNGIYGIRPSHGVVDDRGVMPLARSHDTVGWFARSADILAKVGDVLLPPDTGEDTPFSEVYLARDAWALADPAVAAALAPYRDRIFAAIGPAIDMTLGADCGGLTNWRMTFRFLQMREIWAEHGAWIEAEKPRFGPEIAERFAMSKDAASRTDTGEAETRRLITSRLDDMLAEGGILVIPTAADIAPLKSMSAADSAGFRDRTLTLTCIAGLARLPQVTLPVAAVNGAPVGISLIARHGRDRALLALAKRLAQDLVS